MRQRAIPSACRTHGRFWRQLRRLNERQQAERDAIVLLIAAWLVLVIGVSL